jgi:hypothetical protein
MFTITIPDPNAEQKYKKPLNEASVILSSERVATLSEAVVKRITKALADGTDYSCGVFSSMQRNNMLQVSYQGGELYITISLDIDSKTIKPANYAVFKFNKGAIVEKYNPKEGNSDFTIDEEVHAGFWLFVKFLDGFLEIGSNGNGGHSVVNRAQILNYITAVANKLDVKPTSNFVATGNQPSQTAFSTSFNSGPKINEVDDLSSIL